MLDKNDIALLEGMFEANLKQAFQQNNKELRIEFKEVLHQNNYILRTEFKEALQQNNADLTRHIRDETHSVISASEHRMRIWMTSKLESLKTEIVTGVIDVVDGGVLPQIDKLRTDMTLVKNHLKLA